MELDGPVGGRARGDAEAIGEFVGAVSCRGLCGVSVIGGGTRTIASAIDREPTEEWFEEHGE
jgi:hypothetical protein